MSQINSMLRGIQIERDKMRQAFENESTLLASHNATSIINALRNSLNQVCYKNPSISLKFYFTYLLCKLF